MRSPRLVVVAALCVAGLSGCSSGQSAIPASVSARFERDVRDIARIAAAHRYTAALDEVEALRTSVREALAAGDLGADRAARITASLDLVATDLLKAKRAATPSSTARPSRSAPVASAPVRTATPAPLTEEQVKKAEEARKKAAEEAEKEAEEARKEAEKHAEKQDEEREEHKGKGDD